MPDNVDIASNREEFRAWLAQNHASERECWLCVRRGRPTPDAFAYLDAVEEALCFGWIDGHLKSFPELGTLQRLTSRAEKNSWSELNKERVRRLERLGLMTDAGRACPPAMVPRSFHVDREIVSALKAVCLWSRFKSFPPLYQRVRADNIRWAKARPEEFGKRLNHLIQQTKKSRMHGDWDDFGRLCD